MNLLNEILNEAMDDFNLGGIRGGGYTAGKLGMKIADFKNKFGGVSSTKGLAGVYKASKQAQKALTNLGMNKVTIGSGVKDVEGYLSFSVDDNITNINYLKVEPNVLRNIQNICRITGNEFKQNRQNNKLWQLKIRKTDTRLFYSLEKNNVMYYGMSNTKGKFYVPSQYTQLNSILKELKSEDTTFLNKEGYNPTEYKVYNFDLTVKPN